MATNNNGPVLPRRNEGQDLPGLLYDQTHGREYGVGLSLSYDIVIKGHGGELKVDTPEGEFTEFVITLKRADQL